MENEQVVSTGGAQFKKQTDGSWLGTGKNPSNDTYEIRSPFKSKQLSGVLLESFSDPSFKGIKFGRSGNGNFVMTGLEVRLEHKDKNKKPIVLKLDKAEASYEQEGYPAIQVVKNAANLKKKGSKGWAVHGSNPSKQRSLMAMFMAKSPISVPEGAELVITIYHQSAFSDHNLGRFRIQYAEKKVRSLDGVSGIPENLVPLVQKNVERLAPQELKQLKIQVGREHQKQLQEKQRSETLQQQMDILLKNNSELRIFFMGKLLRFEELNYFKEGSGLSSFPLS